ncbi:MAG: GntR family transcriptional regulator [Acidimicrobiaceae bacterium]|nr:GntR family transcriptional regulator [Acidimicrobiaceae bacterium]MCY4176509.1 GntR family transcriptional regulator [Acidimicrobiaceae bacterium]MCY4280472.1 GntR family transcriptional regulator [Acidimicrobiaceae bacterium]MCY4294844.1 GntR family transcriptional regulator [Acidimicrobiaceae bacterium]
MSLNVAETGERPLREVVACRLRLMILEGALKPGERLVEGQLAERLGVSRNPVREAMRSLEATGLIEVVPRRGASVIVIDPEEAHHIQQIRILVEGYAIEQAAKLGDAEALERIRLCIERGRRATERGDAVEAAVCHRQFHIAVEAAAGMPFLQQMLDPLRQQTELVFSVVTDRRGDVTWDEHEAIYNAISAGDAETAREMVRSHIMNALDSFQAAAET